MSKAKTPATPNQIIKLRRKYRRHNVIGSFLWGFLIIFLMFAYVFLYSGYYGYGGAGGLTFMDTWHWIRYIPYFDTELSIIAIFTGDLTPAEYFQGDTLYRFLILVGTIVLAVLVAVIYGIAHGRRLKKKYKNAYLASLVNSTKFYDVDIDILDKKTSAAASESHMETLKMAGAIEAKTEDMINFKNPTLDYVGVQVTYKYKDAVRNGYLLSTTLEKSKTEGFIQLRNYGKPIITDYQGQNLERYGFADNNTLSRFVCYSNLDQEIYRVIDSKMAQEIFNIQHFLSSSIVVTLAGNDLSIFIDGFRLKLDRPLKKKIASTGDKTLIDNQAEALAALDACFTNIAKTFTKELIESFEESATTGLE